MRAMRSGQPRSAAFVDSAALAPHLRRGPIGAFVLCAAAAASGCATNYQELAAHYADKRDTHNLQKMIEEGEPPAKTAAAKALVRVDASAAQNIIIPQYRQKQMTAADVTDSFLGAEDFGFSVLMALAADPA